MVILRQMLFSLVFAILAVAVAEFVIWAWTNEDGVVSRALAELL
jgi:hypothetical protein